MYMNPIQNNESNNSQNEIIGANYHRLQFLPSKKILMLIASIVIVVCGFFIYPHISNCITRIIKKAIPIYKQPTISRVNSAFDRDTDGDGIPDWQETLFDLNPAASDTDGDGVVDTIPDELQSLSENSEIVTTTDKLALEIYNTIKQTDSAAIDESQISRATAEAVLKTADTLDRSFARYTQKDLSIVIATSASKLAYKTKITPLLRDTKIDETRLIKLTAEISKRTTPPDSYISKLSLTINRLLKTTVVHEIATEQLDLINALSVLSQIYKQPLQTEQTTQYLELLVIKKNLNVINKSVQNIELYNSLN